MKHLWLKISLLTVFLISLSCAKPGPWPQSPLYALDISSSMGSIPQSREEAMQAIAGHYAHYDIVAYEDNSTKTPMRTFTISYGFTDFFVEDGKLFQKDVFKYSSYKINQKSVKTHFSNESVEAIEPKIQEVELTWDGSFWKIFRPESPTLLGIDADPLQPLSKDPNDPGLTDPDQDGNPGVTVYLTIAGFIKGEIYITRREIYQDYLTLYPDGRIIGHVDDFSEQFVIDATMKILRQQTNPMQVKDPGLNPIILVPVDENIDTWEELEKIRHDIFPPEPEFY